MKSHSYLQQHHSKIREATSEGCAQRPSWDPGSPHLSRQVMLHPLIGGDWWDYQFGL